MKARLHAGPHAVAGGLHPGPHSGHSTEKASEATGPRFDLWLRRWCPETWRPDLSQAWEGEGKEKTGVHFSAHDQLGLREQHTGQLIPGLRAET